MSLPSIEPQPEENAPLPPARRRRQRRLIMPQGEDERAGFLRALSYRTVPSFDFFLFSLLSGIVLAAALLLDSPALFILAALLAPFMAPAIGISLGTVTGALRFTLRSLGSLGIGSLIVFLCGVAAGWAASLLPRHSFLQAAYHSRFTWADFFVLLVGAALTTYLLVRSPNQKPLVSSVAIAYGLYLPAGAAGFGLISRSAGLWPDGLILFIVHFVWASAAGALVLVFLGLRPRNAAGVLLSAFYGLAGLALLAWVVMPRPALSDGVLPQAQVAANAATGQPAAGQQPAAEQQPVAEQPASEQPPQPGAPTSALSATSTPTPLPARTHTPTASPTRTLVPSNTPTITITPVPTPVWAYISAREGDGALIREQPNFDAQVLQSILNGTLVEVLPEVTTSGGSTWVHIRTVNGKDGWIVRSLLRTATPAPGW